MRGVSTTKVSSAMRRFVAMRSMAGQLVRHLVWGCSLVEGWQYGYGRLGVSQLSKAINASHHPQAMRRAQSWWVCLRRWPSPLLGEHR